MAESLDPGKRDGRSHICSDQPSTSSSSGEGIIIIDSDTSSSDDLDEIEELPNSENKTFTRQNSRLSIDSVSLSGNDGLEWICVRRLARSTTFRRKKSLDKEKQSKNANDATRGNKKRRKFWSFRFKKRLHGRLQRPRDDSQPKENHPCVCTEIRRTDDHLLGAGIVFSAASTSPQLRGTGVHDQHIVASSSSQSAHGQPHLSHAELLQIVPAPPGRSLPPCTDEDVGPFEDIDEMLTSRREREMREGIEIPVSEMMRMYPLTSVGSRDPSQVMGATAGGSATAGGPKLDSAAVRGLTDAFQNLSVISNNGNSSMVQANIQIPGTSCGGGATTQGHYSPYRCLMPQNSYPYPHRVHTQVDYIHCLVPDLLKITNCGFYWGVMDRYEAEKLLENRPEGTFLLRDSAQDEFLFSVSFRRYGRSLHARIEQWNHRFSFDSHDPGVFASDSVCGLIEHYKDPCCCMFFEPMLILPLNRTFPFSLQHICRSVICSNLTYDSVELLPLPNSLKDYLKYYHYKQKVRVRRFDCMPY